MSSNTRTRAFGAPIRRPRLGGLGAPLLHMAVALLLVAGTASARKPPHTLVSREVRINKEMNDYYRDLEIASSEAARERLSARVQAAGAADVPERFTLWLALPLDAPATDPNPCPNFPRKNVSTIFKARWPQGEPFVYSQTYQWQGTHCYMLVLLAPGANSSMRTDIEAALSGATPVASYCALFADGFCGMLQDKYSAKLASVAINEKAPTYWPGDYACTQDWFEQELDHFNDADPRTFKQRYYVCADAWPADPNAQRENGTIILLQGAEAPVSGPPMSALIWENAAKHNAIVFSLEHRYYGDSFPFDPAPTDSTVPAGQLQWLTVDQVVADSAYFVEKMREKFSVPAPVPVVAFGGSYGGEVVAWLRAGRPDTFAASVASSAPIKYVIGTPLWSREGDRYFETVSAAIAAASPGCGPAIKKGLDEIVKLSATRPGRFDLAKRLALCGPAEAVTSKAAGVALTENYYWPFAGYAQYDNQPPRYGQVALACGVVTAAAAASPGDALAPLRALAEYDGTILSYDPDYKCYQFQYSPKEPKLASNFSGLDIGYLDSNLYMYQCCANGAVFAHMMSRKANKTEPYLTSRVSPGEMVRECRTVYGPGAYVKPASVMTKAFPLLSNLGGVVFTNGQLDPWSGGSPRSDKDLKASPRSPAGIDYITYTGVAHCNDFSWYQPFEAAGNKALRARAIGTAVEFAQAWRRERMA